MHTTMPPLDINPFTSRTIHDLSITTSIYYDKTLFLWHQSFDINYINDNIGHQLIHQWYYDKTSTLWHQWKHNATISPFDIDGNTNIDVNTNHWWKHVDMEILFINSHLNHINVTISPPLTLMEKGNSLLVATPPSWNFLGVAPPI